MMAEDVATITTDESKRITNEDLLAAIRGLDGDADRDRLPSEARISVDPGTKRYDVLWIVFESGPITAAKVGDRLGKSATGVLTRLHDAFLIDRDGDRYEVNDLGRAALNGGNQTLDDIDSDKSDDDDPDPWESTPLAEGEYVVLQAIADASGHVESRDLLDAYGDAGFDASTSAVSARLTCLFDNGFVDRTPVRPYRYWITDDGDDLLGE